MEEICKKPANIHKVAQSGKEITIPPEAQFEPGDEVIQLYNSSVLIVRRGVTVDEKLLRQAIMNKE